MQENHQHGEHAHQEHEEHEVPEIEGEGMPKGLRAVAFWVQIAVCMVMLCAVIGQWYVYRDRQDRTDKEVSEIKEDRKGKIEEYNRNSGEMKQWIEAQKRLNDRIEAHLSDKSIHVTEDQLKNLVAAQLQDVKVAMGKAEVNLQSQQKQLDRMETLLEQLVQAMNQQRLNAQKNN